MEGQRPNEIIAKQIRPTVSEDNMSEMRLAEHRRFLKGFEVEAAAYANLSAELLAAELAVPSLLHLEMPMPEEPQWSLTLHLEDLSQRFPRGANGQVRRMSSEVAGRFSCPILGAPKGGAAGVVATRQLLDFGSLGKVAISSAPGGL
ncbi:unnamed protein product [Durusdinium trenchii]|uniref:Uncharacterized protein n=1 Tax=Durusdinium trenchii TaxID=1381693 RepID=A0ABP0P1W7_9DINO